jgi:hydrogenase maturation protein HypF
LLAPNNPNLGVMLPYTPLHHLLLSLLGFPVVATSGNLSDEPICTDERDALARLGGIADLFLVHNRPIVRHVDDSIVRMMAGRELVLRRARGYAPLPVRLPGGPGEGEGDDLQAASPASPDSEGAGKVPRGEGRGKSVLAVGAHLKNTIALSVGPQAFVSQHIGDLETDQSYEAFCRVIADFGKLYETAPSVVAADAHPDYLSTKYAHDREGPSSTDPQLISVQHHVAHVLSCMAENELEPPVLGVSWDGTGYGLDGTVWGGEFFLVTGTLCERVAHLRRFRLPGGDKAVKEPRRTALGLLYELYEDQAFAMGDLAPVSAFSPAELASLKTMLGRQLNSPLTSSAGRLFDAVAALAGLRQQVRFEGQAAMELEFALETSEVREAYPLSLTTPALADEQGPPQPADRSSGEKHSALRTPRSALVLDWAAMLEAILADIRRNVPVGTISMKFHNGLVEAIISVARRIGQERVVLSGGCFQNRYLTERAIERLQEEGFRPYWHQRIPPNDGGIALGQVMAALRASA